MPTSDRPHARLLLTDAHVDDGIGGHPVMCPLIQAGIQLDPANAAKGRLQLLAGSHRYAKHWVAWGEEGDLPVVALETQPADLTLHYGDTMHSTPPPTSDDAGRRADCLVPAELSPDLAPAEPDAWQRAGQASGGRSHGDVVHRRPPPLLSSRWRRRPGRGAPRPLEGAQPADPEGQPNGADGRIRTGDLRITKWDEVFSCRCADVRRRMLFRALAPRRDAAGGRQRAPPCGRRQENVRLRTAGRARRWPRR